MIPHIKIFVFNNGLTYCAKAWTKEIANLPEFLVGDKVFATEMTFTIILRVYDCETYSWRYYGEAVNDLCQHLRDLKSNEIEPPHPLELVGWKKVLLTPQQRLEVNFK